MKAGTRVSLASPAPYLGMTKGAEGLVTKDEFEGFVETQFVVEGKPSYWLINTKHLRVIADVVEPGYEPDPGFLTQAEHDLVEQLGALKGQFKDISAGGSAHRSDAAEVLVHVHALQNVVLANASARVYPSRYRVFGGDPVRATQEIGDDQ